MPDVFKPIESTIRPKEEKVKVAPTGLVRLSAIASPYHTHHLRTEKVTQGLKNRVSVFMTKTAPDRSGRQERVLPKQRLLTELDMRQTFFQEIQHRGAPMIV